MRKRKRLYIKIRNEYYPMKKVEWEEGKYESAEGFEAMCDDETGELVWDKMGASESSNNTGS